MTDEQYIEAPAFLDADFCLIWRGDSMINDRICDGDTVYIRQQDSVENGEIAAVMIGEEATLRRVWIDNDYIVLVPSNHLYASNVFRAEEMDNVRILGKAVACISAIQ